MGTITSLGRKTRRAPMRSFSSPGVKQQGARRAFGNRMTRDYRERTKPWSGSVGSISSGYWSRSATGTG